MSNFSRNKIKLPYHIDVDTPLLPYLLHQLGSTHEWSGVWTGPKFLGRWQELSQHGHSHAWWHRGIREVKDHVYVKQQTQICTTWPSFFFTCRLLFIISTPKLVVSRKLMSMRIVLSCFYFLNFYFEKFSTWICRLPLAIYVKLKLYCYKCALFLSKGSSNNCLLINKRYKSYLWPCIPLATQ